MGAEYTQNENTASESLENQGLQEPESDLSGKRRELAVEPINEVTWKLTDGGGIIAWEGDGSVRYRNKASKPMRLPKASFVPLADILMPLPMITIELSAHSPIDPLLRLPAQQLRGRGCC